MITVCCWPPATAAASALTRLRLPTLAMLPSNTPTDLPPSETPPPVTAIVGIPTPTPASAFGEMLGELIADQMRGGLFEANSLEQVYV
ncbi:MAG: hypothetical protein U0694_21420 [Anaerolineae bacterium]